MWPLKSRPVVPVLRLCGPIGLATPLQSSLSSMILSGPIEKAFTMSRCSAVAIIVNSPGGSPVQSDLILKRVRQLAAQEKKRVYVFCEDVAASGGYYIAISGDEVYANVSSIIGSIGVISAGFGFDKLLQKIGIERRVYTAGLNKSTLDPFKPENPKDVEHIKTIQKNIHDSFIGVVKDRRAGKLKGTDIELFSGSFWTAPQALEFGLIDGISDVRTKMREVYGDKVSLKLVPIYSGNLLSRLYRRHDLFGKPSVWQNGTSLSDEILSTIEARLMWSRYGL
ncbi:MAG: hypothetical protein TECD_00193 [Hyphomicrobiaceae bacterium hypho_1]